MLRWFFSEKFSLYFDQIGLSNVAEEMLVRMWYQPVSFKQRLVTGKWCLLSCYSRALKHAVLSSWGGNKIVFQSKKLIKQSAKSERVRMLSLTSVRHLPVQINFHLQQASSRPEALEAAWILFESQKALTFEPRRVIRFLALSIRVNEEKFSSIQQGCSLSRTNRNSNSLLKRW